MNSQHNKFGKNINNDNRTQHFDLTGLKDDIFYCRKKLETTKVWHGLIGFLSTKKKDSLAKVHEQEKTVLAKLLTSANDGSIRIATSKYDSESWQAAVKRIKNKILYSFARTVLAICLLVLFILNNSHTKTDFTNGFISHQEDVSKDFYGLIGKSKISGNLTVSSDTLIHGVYTYDNKSNFYNFEGLFVREKEISLDIYQSNTLLTSLILIKKEKCYHGMMENLTVKFCLD